MEPAPQPCCSSPSTRMSSKEAAKQRLNASLEEIERQRKLVKFFDKFPEAAQYLEDCQLWIYS